MLTSNVQLTLLDGSRNCQGEYDCTVVQQEIFNLGPLQPRTSVENEDGNEESEYEIGNEPITAGDEGQWRWHDCGTLEIMKWVTVEYRQTLILDADDNRNGDHCTDAELLKSFSA